MSGPSERSWIAGAGALPNSLTHSRERIIGATRSTCNIESYKNNAVLFSGLSHARRETIIQQEQSMATRDWLLHTHRLRCEEESVRKSVPFDMQAAMDDPVSGGAWDIPLRLIAREHMAFDTKALVMYRVCRKWEYCWRLAYRTIEIDLKALCRNMKTSKIPLVIERPLCRTTYQRRKREVEAYMLKGFEVKSMLGGLTDTGSKGVKVTAIKFMGSTEVVVPADANVADAVV